MSFKFIPSSESFISFPIPLFCDAAFMISFPSSLESPICCLWSLMHYMENSWNGSVITYNAVKYIWKPQTPYCGFIRHIQRNALLRSHSALVLVLTAFCGTKNVVLFVYWLSFQRLSFWTNMYEDWIWQNLVGFRFPSQSPKVLRTDCFNNTAQFFALFESFPACCFHWRQSAVQFTATTQAF